MVSQSYRGDQVQTLDLELFLPVHSPELCQEASSGEVFLLASAALANITFFEKMACEMLLQLNAIHVLLEACGDKQRVDTPYTRDQVRTQEGPDFVVYFLELDKPTDSKGSNGRDPVHEGLSICLFDWLLQGDADAQCLLHGHRTGGSALYWASLYTWSLSLARHLHLLSLSPTWHYFRGLHHQVPYPGLTLVMSDEI